MSHDTPATRADEAPLPKAYEPHAIEQKLYARWEQAGYFAPAGDGAPYCIMIPPPNVTGSLHMGHAFQDTLMDTLIRYHRMLGDRTLWQAGTDHAGIATQMVVERQLEAEGRTRHHLGREKFIERVWEWKAQSGGRITQQLRRLGASLDWSRERFTMDEGLSRAVAEVFVRLYEEGLIYRGKRLVNWDPVLHTAVSDLEVVSEEENGSLWHIRYPLATGAGHLVVATTRPETLLGDAAVAVHPNDERYAHLIGALVELPLTGRRIPVIADEYVDPAFGTGCVKITPAHDFNDYQVWLRHRDEAPLKNVPQNGLINIFTPDARVELPGSPYHGLDRFECRKRLVADLEAAGLLEKTEAHKLMVPRGDRTNAVIEPYLTDQWYVKVGPLAEEAIKAVEDGRIRFVPDTWAKTYFEWMRNIQDWCISRQIWWGHQIPAWYCVDCGSADGSVQFHGGDWRTPDGTKIGGGTIRIFDRTGIPFDNVVRGARIIYIGEQARPVVSRNVPDACPSCSGKRFVQDPDVLDTWFSSALWPFSTLGWPEKTPELETFYPTNVLVTGFDIIFFWVARMIMMGLKFMGDVPFREVYITGLIRDAHGQKMSKSKGNILDPLDLIDGIDLESLVAKRTTGLMQPQMAKRIEQATRKEYPNGIPAFGTDALRFTMASLATQGRDIKFDLGRIEGYRNFCNKLWNAARYVLMNTEGRDCGQGGGRLSLNHVDRWILGRLQQVTAEVRKNFSEYRFDLAAQALYSFTWHEYCDWYLELSKVVLTDSASSADAQRGTRHTLVQVLESLLRLLHPIMPFITEEIWLRVAPLAGKDGPSIMLEPYPDADESKVDAAAIEELDWVMAVVTAVRTVRSERDIAPSKALPVLLAEGDARERTWMERNEASIKLLGRMEALTWLDRADTAPEAVMQLVGHMKVLVPLGSLIDKTAELARLEKEMEKVEKELAKARGQLGNADFVARAPKRVVEQMQQRAQRFEAALADLKNQHQKVTALPG